MGRRGNSTFKYKGRETDDGLYEDWLNDVAPSLMYFRSYLLEIDAHINHFTIDAMASSVRDHSDSSEPCPSRIATLVLLRAGVSGLLVVAPIRNVKVLRLFRQWSRKGGRDIV